MKSLIIATSALGLAVVAAPAFAQTFTAPTAYGTLGYTGVELQNKNLSEVTGRLGLRFGRYLGVEGEAGTGVDGIHSTVAGVATKLTEEPSFAAYGVGYFPLSPKLDLFVRVGYGDTQIRAETAANSTTNLSHSLNYGGGAQYFFDGANGVRADYIRRDFQEGSAPKDTDTWSVGYVRRF